MRHRFHSLCPYFAMFPETFVEKWVSRLTKENQVVLDPFCGRGTTPFQALLMGRQAIASDVNPVAYCVTKAKTNAPSATALRRRITVLESGFKPINWEKARRQLGEFFQYAYSRSTLRQILYLRSMLKWDTSNIDCMVAALILGSLHGESEKSGSYLSNQMPRTISTKPAYSVKYWKTHGFKAPDRDVFELLRNRVTFRYASHPPDGTGTVLRTDMRELPRLVHDTSMPIKCVITSPPYLDVTNFEEDQWLRLWFLGGAPHPTYGVVSKDDRHGNAGQYWNLISDMWRVLGRVLMKKSDVVIRIGGKNFNSEEMGKQLRASSVFSKRKVELVHSETSEIKKRQTDAFRPGSKGCLVESDFHFQLT